MKNRTMVAVISLTLLMLLTLCVTALTHTQEQYTVKAASHVKDGQSFSNVTTPVGTAGTGFTTPTGTASTGTGFGCTGTPTATTGAGATETPTTGPSSTGTPFAGTPSTGTGSIECTGTPVAGTPSGS